MVVDSMPNLSRRWWMRRLIEAGLVIGISGVLVACLYPAVQKARNAARSADTT
jgi:hypothetical protein